MPASELDEWRAYASHEPLPDPYWIGAQICQVVVNMNRSKGPAAKVEDFIPRIRPDRPRQTPEEMRAVFLKATQNCK